MLHQFNGSIVGFGDKLVEGEVDWRKGVDEDVDPDDEVLSETPEDVVAVLGFDPLEEEASFHVLGGEGNPYRGEDGKYTSGGGGASGSGKGKEAPAFGYHGTTVSKVQSILKQGLIVSKKKAYGDKTLYAGDRGQSVFFARSFDDADSWAYYATNGDKPIAIFKVRFPKGTKVQQDKSENGKDFYHVGKIDPSWIVEVQTKEPLGQWKKQKIKANAEEDVAYVVVVLEEQDSFHTLRGGVGSGNFGHAGREGLVGGSGPGGDGGFVRAGRLSPYHLGKRVQFRAPLGTIKPGRMGTISEVTKERVTVKLDRGGEIHLAPTSDHFSKQRSWDKYVAFEIDNEPLHGDKLAHVRQKAFEEATLPLQGASPGEHVIFLDKKLDVHIATIVGETKPGSGRVEIEEISGMRDTVDKKSLRRPKGGNMRHNQEWLKALAGEGNPYRGADGKYTSGDGAGGAGKAEATGTTLPKRTLQAQVKHYGGTMVKGANFIQDGEWNVKLGGKQYQFSSFYNPSASRWHYKEKGTNNWKPAGDYPEEFIPKMVGAEKAKVDTPVVKKTPIVITPPTMDREQGRKILADMIKGAAPIGGNFYVAGMRGKGKDVTNVTLEIYPFENSMHLAFIGVGKEDGRKGVGTAMMEHLTRKADEHGIAMDLDVSPQGKGGPNKAQLFSWYKKFGFERQPYMSGEGMSEHMVRQPKSLKPKTNTFHSLTSNK